MVIMASGYFSAHSPVTKNVAGALCFFKIDKISSKSSTPQALSKVRAISGLSVSTQ